MAAPTSTKTVYDLPTPGTRTAPSQFKGNHNKVKKFLDHYERLLSQCNVIDDVERCQSILMYCNRRVSQFIEALDSFVAANWAELKKDILHYYDADLDKIRWREKDLALLTQNQRRSDISTLKAWKSYEREFICIGNWLKSKKKIDEQRYQAYFWSGLPKNLRRILEDRIIAQNPTLTLETPFSVDKVRKAAHVYFQRDRFANLIPDSDEEESSEDSDSSSDSEYDSSDSDSYYRPHKKRRSRSGKSHAKAHAKMDKLRKKLQANKSKDINEQVKEEPHMLPSNGKGRKPQMTQQEVDDLIRQLSRMSLSDPAYAGMYYKAISFDKVLEKCIRPPSLVQPATIYQSTPSNNAYSSQPKSPGPYRPGMIDRCYGCFGVGHSMNSCQKMTELLQSGIVRRDNITRQFLLPDGSPIRREQNESLAQAAERSTGRLPQSQSHLYFIKPTVTFEDPYHDTEFDESSESEYDSDDEDDFNEFDDDVLWDDQQDSRISPRFEEVEDGNVPDEEEEYEEFEEDQDAFYVMPEHLAEYTNEFPVYEVGPDRALRSRTTRSTRQAISETPRATRERTKAKLRGPPGRPPGIPASIIPTDDAARTPAPSSAPPPPSPPTKPPPQNASIAPQTTTSIPPNNGRVSAPVAPRFVRRDLFQDSPKPPSNNGTYHEVPTRSISLPRTPTQPHVLIPKNVTRGSQVPASESAHELRSLDKARSSDQYSPNQGGNQLKEVPFDARLPRPIPSPEETQDVEMKDAEPVSRPRKQTKSRVVDKDKGTENRVARRPGRQSELSARISETQIVDRLLDVPVTFKVGEILAVAPRIASNVADVIKPRNVKAPVYRATQAVPQNKPRVTKSPLIRLRMKINDEPVVAIIDTGSQLNVVNKKIWSSIIQLPMDVTQVLHMNDANGGEGELRGLISDVPLTCGSITTTADLYVGEHVPFDLLLGRPWQRGNLVTIDERVDGTYLAFTDHKNAAYKFVIKVARDNETNQVATWAIARTPISGPDRDDAAAHSVPYCHD
jgi:hypothetical protein